MAISHAFSNAVSDGTNTNIVRPSDWNSAHIQHYTLSGNTLGVSTVSGTNVVFQGSGNVSLSGTGSTIIVYGTGGGGGGVALGASSQTATSGTVNFVNSNGITFGMSGSSQITASHNGITTQTVQTQASGNIAGTGFSSTTTAGTAITAALGTNGLTMAIPAYLTAAVGGGGVAIGASSQTATSGTVNFVNSNGITFGMSGSNQITASHNGITTQTVQTQASGNIAGSGFSSTTTAGTAIVGTHNSLGLSLGIPAYLTTQSVQTQASGGIAGTNTSANNASITLNSNGLTISVAPPGGGGVMYANLSGNTSGNTTASGSTLNFSGINITLSGANNSQIAISAPATSSLVAGANITISTAGSTISIIGGAGGGGAAFSAGTQSVSTGTVNFANSNGITFGMAGSNQITASFSQSVQTQASGNIAGLGFSSTTTAGTAIVGTHNSLGLSLGVPAYLTTQSVQTQASGNIAGSGFSSTTTAGTAIVGTNNSNGLSLGVPAYLTTQSVQTQASGNIAGLGFSSTTTAGTAIVGTHNSLGLSLGVPAYLTTQSVQTQASGNIAGSGFSSTTTAGTAIVGTHNSLGLSLGVPAYLTAAGGGGAVNFSAGTTSNNLQTVVFSNSNGVSFGLNGSTITASVAGGAGGINAGVSNLGNTAGSTGTVSTGNVVFVGVNNISLSQSTGAAGSNATISIVGEPPVKSWAYPNPNNLTFLSNHVNASASINVIQVPFDISGTRMDILMYQSLISSATTNTYAQAWSIYMGIYSNDTAASRIYSLSSGSTQTTYTVASNTAGVTQLNGSGVRPISCPVNFTMSEGQYAIVANWVTTASSIGLSTTALAQTLSVVGNPTQSASMAITPEYDVATATSNNFSMPMGMLNVASTGIPASISYSQINMTGLSRLRANFHIALRG